MLEHLPWNHFFIIRIRRRSDFINSWSGLRCWKSSPGKPMFRFSNCLKLLPKSFLQRDGPVTLHQDGLLEDVRYFGRGMSNG
ncbi:hypothetical protein pipiens_006653 [Culex pipiens pipiens]|uniref:Uncharacterized protein n=1 Tax=Culex pipiens pipiens TaxID=38569 RepID=A0ABD1DPM8_CULPP